MLTDFVQSPKFSAHKINDITLANSACCTIVLSYETSCTNGFPEMDRLVSDTSFPSGPAVRLIPEMQFTCNGVIAGFTVALKRKPADRSASMHMEIQVWRPENSSQCTDSQTDGTGASTYYRVGEGIAIRDAVCASGMLEELYVVDTYHCELNETVQVSVEPGDILGLKLPQGRSKLSFANVVKGPTNYIFQQSHLISSDMLSLVNHTSDSEAPQILLDINTTSGKISAIIFFAS